MSKYIQVQAGEWRQPVMQNYKMRCCDCGLVHKINFRIYEGRIQLQAFRDNRSTAQCRRYKNNINE